MSNEKDYLDDVTRRTKSKLLIASSIYIIADKYKLGLTEIPLLGIDFAGVPLPTQLNIIAGIVLYLLVMYIVFICKDSSGVKTQWGDSKIIVIIEILTFPRNDGQIV